VTPPEDRAKKINDTIQTRLKKENKPAVDPVTATHWLIEAGLREAIETRPGSFLRRMCRRGLVLGAEKTGTSWKINRTSHPKRK
jgi:hypothetical protein